MAKNPRQRVPVQVNQFVGGLNTEANPLSYPPTSSIDEQNMSVGRDGSRIRRNGFDVEQDYAQVDTGIAKDSELSLGKSQFRWYNAGGSGNAEFMVVQIGNYMAVHDLNVLPLSSTPPIFTKTFSSTVYSKTFSYAVVDGTLVVVTGEKSFYSFYYKDGVISEETGKLLIRDLFGVQDVVNGTDLTDPQNFNVRPSSLTSEHLYNLRNQTYGPPRVDYAGSGSPIKDPITEFYAVSTSKYPSNSDNLTEFLFADPNNSHDRVVERYNERTNIDTPPSTNRAPLGYFVIDATERGASRKEREAALRANHPELTLSVASLPEDQTPGGASVISQYAGRVWYAGFSGDLLDGDSQSPKMSSYILFSRVVQSPSDIGRCYQDADPTSNIDSSLVDTDGGFIKVDGAYGIKALIPVDTSLFVLAENGVWRIVGLDGDTFSASGYSASKISEEGCIAAKSAVVNNKTVVYWGESGIFGVSQDQVGDWGVTNLTRETIQTFYDGISSKQKSGVDGYYDSDGVAFRWIWKDDSGAVNTHNELILHLKFQVFTKDVVNLPSTVDEIASVAGGQVPFESRFLTVTSEGAVVTSEGENVTVPTLSLGRGNTTAYYTVVTSTSPTILYTFGRYNNTASTYDWVSFAASTDSPAFMLTGSITGGDARLRKDAPYLTVYFRQPENMGDASCVFNARWDWTPDYTAGKWSSPKQIFRRQRSNNDGGVLATRNRVRGSGQSVAFRFESEEGKPMHIYGWEFNLEATKEE